MGPLSTQQCVDAPQATPTHHRADDCRDAPCERPVSSAPLGYP